MEAGDWLTQNPRILVLEAVGTGAVLCGALGLLLLFWLLRPRRRRAASEAPDLSIDLASLPIEPLPAEGPGLEYYGTPVRLVVLVLAPAGRGVMLPAKDELRDLVEDLVPGLSRIVDAQRPIFRRWPQQLSSQGFTQSFFSNVPLPGNRGKGTPWCCVAGKFESGGRQFLAGLVCQAATPNSLSQVVVQHHGQWHDVLRVKT